MIVNLLIGAVIVVLSYYLRLPKIIQRAYEARQHLSKGDLVVQDRIKALRARCSLKTGNDCENIFEPGTYPLRKEKDSSGNWIRHDPVLLPEYAQLELDVHEIARHCSNLYRRLKDQIPFDMDGWNKECYGEYPQEIDEESIIKSPKTITLDSYYKT
jgi:hypothetical protein